MKILRFFVFSRFRTQTQAQFTQLFLVNRIRRICQQALGALGFRESNHVADGFGTGHQSDQTVETERQTAVWRRTEFQVIEQEAEFVLLLFRSDFQGGKYFFLNVGTVDTDRATTNFVAVADDVIGVGMVGAM